MMRGARVLCILGAVGLLAFAQDPPDPSSSARALIARLKSDSIEEREKASDALFGLGRAALPALEEASRGPDQEARYRAKLLVTLIQWGVSPDLPASTRQILIEIATQPAKRKIDLLKQLLKSKDQNLRPILNAVWAGLQDPKVVAAISPWWMRWDTLQAEKKLKETATPDSAAAFEALGDLHRYRLDVSRAADDYARARLLGDTPELFTKWSAAMFQSHRARELADAITQKAVPGTEGKLAKIAGLYRSGRREEGDAEVRDFPRGAELACAYGSPRAVLAIAPTLLGAGIQVRALLVAGELEKAETEWRRLEEEPEDRASLLEQLFFARGDFDLATPGFLEEAVGPAGGKPHLELAQKLADSDPGSALTEYKKAVFLDPSNASTFAALARLAEKEGDLVRARQAWARAAALEPGNAGYQQAREAVGPAEGPPKPAGSGIWKQNREPVLGESLFVPSPVRKGGFTYYLDPLGFLVKARDVADPTPLWTYLPPRPFQLARRGWRYGWWLSKFEVAEWEGHLVVVVDLNANTNSAEGGGWSEGAVISVLDPDNGKELWSRSISGVHGGRIFPKEGVVAFAAGGIAVFDLARRDWKWGSGSQSQIDGKAWIEGPDLFVGLANGILLKLRVEDGGLLWKKGTAGTGRGVILLEPEGNRLLFGVIGRLWAVDPASGEPVWEREWKQSEWGESWAIEKGILYGWGSYPASAWAISLADGKTLWNSVIRREWSWLSGAGLLPSGLYMADNHGLTLLERETGKVLLAGVIKNNEWSGLSGAAAEGDSVTVSTATRAVHVLHSDPDDDARRQRLLAVHEGKRTLYRIVRATSSSHPAAARLAAQETQPSLRASLLEDACYGASAGDAAAWKALAETWMDLGRPSRALETLRNGARLLPPSREALKPWHDLAESWIARAGDLTDNVQELVDEWSKALKTLSLIEEFQDPKTAGLDHADDDQFWTTSTDLLSHPSPVTRVAVAAFCAEAATADTFRTLVLAAPDVDPAFASRSFARLLPRLILTRHWESLWHPGSLETGLVLEALSDCARRARGELRGAAVALMELLGKPSGDPEAAVLLRETLDSREPLLRILAGAALFGRGDARAQEALEKAITSANSKEQTVAVWVVGRVRDQKAIPALLNALNGQEDGSLRGLLFEAVSGMRNPELQEAIVDATRRLEWFEIGHGSRMLRLLGTPAAVDRLLELSRNPASRTVATSAYWELREMDHPKAVKRVLEFNEEELAGAPDEGYFLLAVLGATIKEGRLEEAAADLGRLEKLWPPNAEIAQARFDLALAQGKPAEALSWRAEAERQYGRSREVEPGRGDLAYRSGMMFLRPPAVHDLGRARTHLEEARRLAPENEDIVHALEQVRSAEGGKKD